MKQKVWQILLVLLLALFPACWDDSSDSSIMLELSLYTGIPGVARLSETYQQVASQAQFKSEKYDVTSDPALAKIGITDGLYFKSIGTRVFFRRAGVAMIIAQEPFKGMIKSKNIKLFSFSVPPVSDWEEFLVRDLGQPDARASGGRFSSEALFYNWGDISYNRMGPNEIALYRDPEISKFRMNNFGREIKLFQQDKK